MVAATKKSCKMASTLYQSWFLKGWVFVQNLKILYILDHTVWFKFRQYVVQVRNKYFTRDFRIPMSTFATVAGISFNGKFTEKNGF